MVKKSKKGKVSKRVNTKDLNKAICRVGKEADNVGISIDELLKLVKTAEKTSNKTGKTIRKSLKTILV